MDEFGVLVESIGFKAQGKSAPMAKLKSQPKQQPNYGNGFPQATGQPSKPVNNDPFFVDDLDGIFRPSSAHNSSHSSHDFFGVVGDDDVFGGVFLGSKTPGGAAASSGGSGFDDLFGGNSSSKGSSKSYDDLLFGSTSRNDDFFGLNSNNSSVNSTQNGSGFDDLIPGFEQSCDNGAKPATGRSPQSSGRSNLGSPLVEDPLSVFESFASDRGDDAGRNSSSIDQLEDFAMARPQNNTNVRTHADISKESITKVQEKLRNMKDVGGKRNAADGNIKVSFKKDVREPKVSPAPLNHKHTEQDKKTQQRVTNEKQNSFKNEDVLESFFGNTAERATPTNEDPMFDMLFNGGGGRKVEKPVKKASPGPKQAPISSNPVDDFSFLFEEPALSAVEFQEINGEPEERRRARFNNHMRTKERMAKALQEKNQRDLQAQREQEEKFRLSETLDAQIKRWAAGKEGNLRAMLSSLDQVLWAECGWKPVSLTDLITSISVKKVYHRATLCVHPDKVQQKGANVQQKYIAEKVFDLLKEAWNKFNAEELR